jgi:4'-phosphopantetheinyl transferase
MSSTALFPALVAWLVDLDEAWPSEVLSAQELERSALFVHSVDAQRYRAAHSALRILLAQATDSSVDGIHIDTLPQGKPVMSPEAHGHQTQPFSLSHSGGLGVLLLGEGLPTGDLAQPLGVDVELMAQRMGMAAMMGQYMSDDECMALLALPAADRDLAALRCWTRKEAVLKALGCGLACDPRHITVGLEAGETVLPALLIQKGLKAVGRTGQAVLVSTTEVIIHLQSGQAFEAMLSSAMLLPQGAHAAPTGLRLTLRAASRSGDPA